MTVKRNALRINQTGFTNMNVAFMPDEAQSHAGGIGVGHVPDQDARPQSNNKRSLHILCIDDDELFRKIINQCLTRFEHRVTVAPGGKVGLELFRAATEENQPYEVVITDLCMPDIDGNRVVRTIKAESPKTPVIMMTGRGTFLEGDGEAALPVDAVVAKPPCMQELNDLVLRIVRPAVL
jgi:DNA-binding NtrC family response regulator